ncbi:hypothetical protein E2P81_ATG06494 [Venturia nashicola]|uniref:Uncharacterized protein n=1 Tax=Venturia nashicola TaxID=86259 RepID=A0A4Z1P8W6_9PEZI|nr:hypothetical protein E6O75_ATG06660 [Venturia nashicola]TLD28148.1 hypothetical protein E2P81_ATG06494 [Venturia nashicola]
MEFHHQQALFVALRFMSWGNRVLQSNPTAEDGVDGFCIRFSCQLSEIGPQSNLWPPRLSTLSNIAQNVLISRLIFFVFALLILWSPFTLKVFGRGCTAPPH